MWINTCLLLMVCLMLVRQASCFNGSQLRVLKSNQTDMKTASSGFKLIDRNGTQLVNFTFCIRFKLKVFTRVLLESWPEDSSNHMMKIYLDNPAILIIGYPFEAGSRAAFDLTDEQTKRAEVFDTNRWMHLCYTFDANSKRFEVFVNGRKMRTFNANKHLRNMRFPSNLLNGTYVGRDKSERPFSSSPEQELSDFNIWDRSFSTEEAIQWTSCKSPLKGNIVNWDHAELEEYNVTEYFTDLESLCSLLSPGNVIMPMRKDFKTHLSICRRLQGEALAIQDEETANQVFDETWKHDACVNPPNAGNVQRKQSVWVAYSDEEHEGNFTNVNTGNQLGLTPDTYAPWHYTGEPNGDTRENCMAMWVRQITRRWIDARCHLDMCFFCQMDQYPTFFLRGLCETTKFDYQYSWTLNPLINGWYSFAGYTNTRLIHGDGKTTWRLELLNDPEVYAVTNHTDFPIGTLKWEVHGDSCSEKDLEGGMASRVTLSFSGCGSNEFNCLDGSCVDMNRRCDRKVDCPDKTDEIDCEILKTDVSYLRDIPPPPYNPGAPKALINVSLDLLSIMDIVEVDSLTALQLELRLTWFDKRLTMKNLQVQSSLNTLTDAFKKKIWIPQVLFHNTKDKEESQSDDKSFVYIDRVGQHKIAPYDIVENANTFKGSENPITVSRVYSKDFLCEFNMAHYPFDTQDCMITLIAKGNLGNFIELIPESVKYLGPIDLAQYFVENVKISNSVVPPEKQAVQVNIIFKRRLLATILTTYLPTALLCIVCFSTNHFKAFFFEATVTVNLTSLLVLTTLFISVSNSLPTTSYLKMIDGWLLFTLLVPFTEVLLHTYMDSLRLDDLDRKINKHGDARVVPGRIKPANNNTLREIQDIRDIESNKQRYHPVSNTNRLGLANKVATYGIPSIFVLFVVVYFAVGLSL